MLNKLESVLVPLTKKIGKNKYLITIRDGFLLLMPLLTVGPFFLLVANFSIPGRTDFWVRLFGDDWASCFSKPIDATSSIMAVLTVIGIGYSFMEQMNADKLFGATITLVDWFPIMSYEILVDGGSSTSGIPLDWMGSKGIFTGIIVAFPSTYIYAWVNKKGWVIEIPDGVPSTVVKSFSALISAGISVLVFFTMNIVFVITPCRNAFNFILTILQTPSLRLGNMLLTMVIVYIPLRLFWSFGVNGGSMVGAVSSPILQILSANNLTASQAGRALPNITSQQPQDLLAAFGGCGSILSLLITISLFHYSKRIKELGKLALIPGVFGVNEPIVFGLPIVLSPMILIPFVLMPTINIVISYSCMSINLIPICMGVAIPWTVSAVLSGFLTTGWQGAVLWLLLLIPGVFIYMPFIRMMDKQYLEDEAEISEKPDDDGFDFGDPSFDNLQGGCP